MKKRIIVGITGASGVIYGIRVLELLKKTSFETHLILSDAGKLNIGIETDYTVAAVAAMADVVHDHRNWAASVASGSFPAEGMMVVPCTIKTLSGITNSFTENLLLRAADVALKEKRKLLLMVRETPLHLGHLRLMTRAAELGAHILPPIPAFYHRPKTLQDIIDHTVGKIFDYFRIPHHLFDRWGEKETVPLPAAHK